MTLLLYLLFLPVAVAVGYGVRRDIRRAVARAERRRAWATFGRALGPTWATVAAVGVPMAAAVRAAHDFEAAMRQVNASMAAAATAARLQLQRAAARRHP